MSAYTTFDYNSWAGKTGPATARIVERIMESRAHPQQGFRSCLGILRLEKRYGSSRLEAACMRSLELGATSYRSLESILRRKLDSAARPGRPDPAPIIAHGNVRGPKYYQ